MLVLYGYIQPYKFPVANALEVIVQLDFLFLLLLISSQVLERFYALPPIQLGEGGAGGNSTCGHKKGVAKVVWFLTPFYYFPLLLLVGVAVGYIVWLLYR